MVLASSLTTRWITIKEGAERELGPFPVRPPAVSVALPVLEASEVACRFTHPGFWTALRVQHDAVRGWLPVRLREAVRRMLPMEQSDFLVSLLSVGTEDSAVHRATVEEAKKPVLDPSTGTWRTPTWADILADYRTVFGGSLREILSEPWPLFLDGVGQMRRLRGTLELADYQRAIVSSGFARPEEVDEWVAQRKRWAGWTPPPKGTRDPRWEQKQREQLEALRTLTGVA